MSAPEPAGVDTDADVPDPARTVRNPAPGTATSASLTEGHASPEGSAPGILSRPYLALSIGIVSVVLVIAFEATAVGTAMPVAARELHGIPLYAFAFSSYFTTSLFGMVFAGQWADRRGPLAPLGAGIGAFAAGLVLAGTAGAMWLFVLGRAVQGLGGGLVIVALYVVVGRAYPERLRPSVMAGFAAGWVVPSVVGPLVAGTVTEELGWRWVFLGIPVLVVLPLALALPQIRRRAQGPAGDAPAEHTPQAACTLEKEPSAASTREKPEPPHAPAPVSGWHSPSPSGPGCCSTPRRTRPPGGPCCRWPPEWRCWSRPCSGCCHAVPTGQSVACRPSCCCAAWPPGRSSPRSRSFR